MKHVFLILSFVFMFAVVMPSCHKSTCPTYSTSGPTKKKKKNGLNPWDSNKVSKKDKGKATTGLTK